MERLGPHRFSRQGPGAGSPRGGTRDSGPAWRERSLPMEFRAVVLLKPSRSVREAADMARIPRPARENRGDPYVDASQR